MGTGNIQTPGYWAARVQIHTSSGSASVENTKVEEEDSFHEEACTVYCTHHSKHEYVALP